MNQHKRPKWVSALGLFLVGALTVGAALVAMGTWFGLVGLVYALADPTGLWSSLLALALSAGVIALVVHLAHALPSMFIGP